MSADANQDRPTYLSLAAVEQQAATPLFKMLDWGNESPYQRHVWAPPGTSQPPLPDDRPLVPCGFGYHLTDAARAFYWQAPLCYPVDTGAGERLFHSSPPRPDSTPLAPKWVVRQATLAPAVTAWGPAAWGPATLRLLAGAVQYQPIGLSYNRIAFDFEIVAAVLAQVQAGRRVELKPFGYTGENRFSPEAVSLIADLVHLSRTGWFNQPTPSRDSYALVWGCYQGTLDWILNTHKSRWWHHRTHPVVAWGAQWVQAILTTGTVPATEPDWTAWADWRPE